MEPKRRFGGRNFRDKIKVSANYKRVFQTNPSGFWQKITRWFFGSLRIWKILGTIIILAAVYFLFISTNLLITNITVAGNQAVTSQQIIDALNQADNSRIFLIKKNNYLDLNQGPAGYETVSDPQTTACHSS